MKKYIFFVTNQEHLLKAAIRLYENKIAEPIIWLGDDRLYEKAKKFFKKNIFSDLDIKHRNYENLDYYYNGELNTFFKSQNYYRAKDICLKMMDRLDQYGTFSRIDREVYFHNVLLFFLKHINEKKPDVLIANEAPHDFVKYIIFEICLFKKIPCFKFNNWTLLPLLFIVNLEDYQPIPFNQKTFGKFDSLLNYKIEDWIKLVSKDNYEISYMSRQKTSSRISKKIYRFFNKGIKIIYRDLKHNLGMKIRNKYSPINPYRLNLYTRLKVKNKRKSNLLKSLIKNSETPDLHNTKYVYFPLHFEPERTTNPDGGYFHDQFLAIESLRKLVPSSIAIFVKEHPSQIFFSGKGSRGRSPLIYSLIKKIENTKIVSTEVDTIDLIKNSNLVATISGTVAIEASILGKHSIVFGNSWYAGCPNIFSFSDNISYENIISQKIVSPKKITDFFLNLKNEYSFLSFQNQSQKIHNNEFDNDEFNQIQNESIYMALKKIIEL